ncbi:MAG: SUMF1/EgtB/PvdO family nonheme iron enzyme [Deltaproteobacteria bacterium]|nr:SUMF1/EgtB/PvdO family nonheme iron enzyme [Deltaproteobacteria bacterium]
MTAISWDAAARAAAWMGGHLPNELEIEKAGRGVDGRFTPWGREIEPRWSRVLGSSPSPPGMLPLGAVEGDESPTACVTSLETLERGVATGGRCEGQFRLGERWISQRRAPTARCEGAFMAPPR